MSSLSLLPSSTAAACPIQKSSQTSLGNLITASKTKSRELAQACDEIIAHAFKQHFTREVQEYFGLTVLAAGSYGKKSQVIGSDADILLVCCRVVPNEESIRPGNIEHISEHDKLSIEFDKQNIKFAKAVSDAFLERNTEQSTANELDTTFHSGNIIHASNLFSEFDKYQKTKNDYSRLAGLAARLTIAREQNDARSALEILTLSEPDIQLCKQYKINFDLPDYADRIEKVGKDVLVLGKKDSHISAAVIQYSEIATARIVAGQNIDIEKIRKENFFNTTTNAHTTTTTFTSENRELAYALIRGLKHAFLGFVESEKNGNTGIQPTLARQDVDLKENFYRVLADVVQLLKLYQDIFPGVVQKTTWQSLLKSLEDSSDILNLFRTLGGNLKKEGITTLERKFEEKYGKLDDAKKFPATDILCTELGKTSFLVCKIIEIFQRSLETGEIVDIDAVLKCPDTFAECLTYTAKQTESLVTVVANKLRAFVAMQKRENLPNWLSDNYVGFDRHKYQKYGLFEHGMRTVEEIAKLESASSQQYYQENPDKIEAKFARLFQGDLRLGVHTKNLAEDTILQQQIERDKLLLALACFLHDIGKKQEIEQGQINPYFHAEEGAKIVQGILNNDEFRNLNLTDDEKHLIIKLVRSHLVLKDAAKNPFTSLSAELRNILHDENTANNKEQFLKLLTLLTYADLKSNNSTDWDEFRAARLWYSYKEAAKSLANEKADTDHVAIAISREEEVLTYITSLREVIELGLHLSIVKKIPFYTQLLKLPDPFRRLPKSVAVQLLTCGVSFLNDVENTECVETSHPVVIFNRKNPTSSEIDFYIVASDKNYLLSNAVNVLSNAGYSIKSADVFTSSDGVAYQRFSVVTNSGVKVEDRQLRNMVNSLKQELSKSQLSIPVLKVTGAPGKNFHVTVENSTAMNLASSQVVDGNITTADKILNVIKIKAEEGGNSNKLLLRMLIALNKANINVLSCAVNSEGDAAENYFVVLVDKLTQYSSFITEIQAQI